MLHSDAYCRRSQQQPQAAASIPCLCASLNLPAAMALTRGKTKKQPKEPNGCQCPLRALFSKWTGRSHKSRSIFFHLIPRRPQPERHHGRTDGQQHAKRSGQPSSRIIQYAKQRRTGSRQQVADRLHHDGQLGGGQRTSRPQRKQHHRKRKRHAGADAGENAPQPKAASLGQPKRRSFQTS